MRASWRIHPSVQTGLRRGLWSACPPAALVQVLLGCFVFVAGAGVAGPQEARQQPATPPRVRQAQRLLAQRGYPHAGTWQARLGVQSNALATPAAAAGITYPWRSVGPAAVTSLNYGLTTGRVTSLALDPSDATGNRLYVGTTGGGVWVAQNAASSDPSLITFTPLTDAALAQLAVVPPTLSIGALSVQPGGTGVILAGTGDPNDALDSYYGDGIFRSKDNGQTWTRIERSSEVTSPHGFTGVAFAGFAWSTTNPNLVVAAVTRAYEASIVVAETPSYSYTGLYYSSDAGVTWKLATIKDLNGSILQGPNEAWAGADGNAATAVVWNPIRHMFIAAVQFHGYYQSPDGATWTRLVTQPGTGFSTTMCPTNYAMPGSTACPIFRGALAVNSTTGDTFAWSVDINNQDQGIWEDVCAASGGTCANGSIAFTKRWSTSALSTATWQGGTTIPNGDYNLALAAVPSGQDTLLFAGDNDVYKCSLAMGCVWRNTTNVNTCMSAAVAPYQHAIEWNASNPQQVLFGNDGGLWRSMDAVSETGSSCNPTDASHWQNLNGGLGSLTEVESMAATDVGKMLAGLGANGTTGVSGGTSVPSNWPEILGGEGGPVAIDPTHQNVWYVNNGAGVSIHVCTMGGACQPADFGQNPVISNASVNNDGGAMTAPAPFLVDPVDPSQLIIGTCRVWRGPASGTGWTTANAVSSMFDGNTSNNACHGNALIRSLAAMALPGGGEVVYAGTYGHFNGGATLPGHVLRGLMSAKGTWSWQDLSYNPVTNEPYGLNSFRFDVSSIYIDTNDTTGNTIYVTLAGMRGVNTDVDPVYRSTDGGAHWKGMESNLPNGPVNAIAVDPSNANIVYVASDAGVFVTQTAPSCGDNGVNCWAAFGTGLPQSPVVALTVLPTVQTLVAGTYGRGIWQIPLLGAEAPITSATVQPTSLAFPQQLAGTSSSPLIVTLKNTGPAPLLPYTVKVTGDFREADDCLNATIVPGGSCTIEVTFTPSTPTPRTGQLTIQANVPGGSLIVPLSGTGLSPGLVHFVPASLDFGTAQVGSQSAVYSMMVENLNTSPVSVKSLTVSGPFSITSNVCGTTLIANSDCQLLLRFTPVAAGPAAGTLTLVDDAGTQTAQLQGMGSAPATDTLSTQSLNFPGTIIGQPSDPLNVTLTNSGGNQLTGIKESVTGPFGVSSNCTTQLIAGANCAITVTFTPTAQGAQQGVLTISDAIKDQTVSLTGTGVLPPVLAATPTSLSFGGQVIGQASAPLTVSISNGGGAALAGLGFQITGASAATFARAATTCTATLAAGASCTVQVVFTPASTGAAAATLTASSSTQGVSPISIALGGNGLTAPTLAMTPAQLTFDATASGATSAAQAITLTNNGGVTADGLTLSITGAFSLVQNGCGTSLASGASCTASVVFSPSQNGPQSGLLTAHASNVSTTATVTLVGTGGLTGVLQLQPATIAFPTTGVGATSSAVAVTLTNSSAASVLQGLTITTTGAFQLASNTCGTALAAGASCTVGVVFAPTADGAAKGSLTVSSSTLATSQSVALSGTGFDYTIIAPGSTSQTVASGQTASYTLSLSAGAAGGTFTFACASLPQYANCLFTPATNTVAGNGSASETVQITTSQTSGQAAPMPPWGGRGIALACGLMLLPLVGRRRRMFLPLVLAAAFLCVGLASCGGASAGGGSTPPPSPTTHSVAAGTYVVQVQGTANGLQHAISLTLKVN